MVTVYVSNEKNPLRFHTKRGKREGRGRKRRGDRYIDFYTDRYPKMVSLAQA